MAPECFGAISVYAALRIDAAIQRRFPAMFIS